MIEIGKTYFIKDLETFFDEIRKKWPENDKEENDFFYHNKKFVITSISKFPNEGSEEYTVSFENKENKVKYRNIYLECQFENFQLYNPTIQEELDV